VNEEYDGRKLNRGGQAIIVPCAAWHVEAPRRITIHKQPGEILPPLNHLGGSGGFRSHRLSFFRNIIVSFIHQMP